MNNKFLIGARRAGFFLVALALLGLGSAWAYTVDLDKVGWKIMTRAAGGVDPAEGSDSLCYGTYTVGSSVVPRCIGPEQKIGGEGSAIGVDENFPIRMVYSSAANHTGQFLDSVLTIGTGTDNITIIGKLKSSGNDGKSITALNQIKFGGTAVVATWDGASVKGYDGTTAKAKAALFDVTTAKLTIKSTGADGIEGSANSIFSGVVANITAVGEVRIGDASPSGSNIILKANGATAIKGAKVVVHTPGSGKYTIESKYTAIQATQSVQIGTTSITEASAGEVVINAWTSVTDNKNETAGAAITVDPQQYGLIAVYGRGGKVSITSKGKYVLWSRHNGNAVASNDLPPNVANGDADADVKATAIYVTQANITHSAPSGTSGAVTFVANEKVSGTANPATGKIVLNEVTVVGPSSGAAVAGQLVDASGRVIITKGTYAPASGTSGNAITSPKSVIITAARITSNAASGKPDYVVASEDSVYLKAGEARGDTAIIAWIGTSGTVGGIKSKKKVIVESNGTTKAEVRIGGTSGGGSGTAIWVYGPSGYRGVAGSGASDALVAADVASDTAVKILGSANASVFVKGNTGRAIVVENESGITTTAGPDSTRRVVLTDAVITRNAAFAAKMENLVEISGCHVFVNGANLTSTAINVAAVAGVTPATNSVGVGLFSVRNGDGSTTGGIGGSVTVLGGSIAGGTGAIEADSVLIGKIGTPGDALTVGNAVYGFRQSTDIKSTSGVTVRARGTIYINNQAANITNTNGVYGNAAVQSTDGDIKVYTVGTILGTTQATALLTTATAALETDAEDDLGKITVNGGTIKSGSGPAILASHAVVVDKATSPVVVLISSGANGQSVSNPWNSAIYVEGSRLGTADAVTVGNAKVEATATAGYASAIRTLNNGNVVVGVGATTDKSLAMVTSTSGNAITVVGGDVDFQMGEVKSEAKTALQNGVIAAIHVTSGAIIDIGRDVLDGYTAKVTADGIALGVYATGNTTADVSVYRDGVFEVKGTAATAGAIKVTDYNRVVFKGNLAIASTTNNSKAFAIEAATGKITVSAGRIKAEDCDAGAVRSTGAPIDITGGFLSANSGVLVWAKKNSVTNRAGLVQVTATGAADLSQVGVGTYVKSKPFWGTEATDYKTVVYNKYGTAVKAEDTVKVGGNLTSTWTTPGVIPGGIALVGTDSDTAIATGTATVPGVVEIYGAERKEDAGHRGAIVWAAGARDKNFGVAVASKKVFMQGGLVEANTARSSIDDEAMYENANVTGIVIRPATKASGSGNLEIIGGEIVANGGGTGIDNRDTLVTVNIHATAAFAVRVLAGNNGTGIRSVGEINTNGDKITEDSGPTETVRYPKVAIYVRAGNGTSARAVWLPIETGAKKINLRLEKTFVEAGNNAVAVEGGKNALVTVDHSVVLVRHASTAIRGLGGVYVDGGYVEVLATENNNTGTAILGNEINISGGHGDVEDKSEIHSKGIAVKDTIAKTPIEVTGIIHMSGTVATRMNIGSSVMGDTGTLSMGSEKSRNLWKLSAASEVTVAREKGKFLVIPAGVTVSVADNASKLETEKFDTLKIAGHVTTVGNQAGAQLVNAGKTIIDKGGNVSYNKYAAASLKNNNGTFVLKTGSMLDSLVIVHDSGTNIGGVQYTFLKLAKILSGDSVGTVGTRGPGKVIVPPLYAALYGNARTFVDDDDMETATKDYWNENSTRTDSVYTAKYIKYPLDRRYKKYINASESDTAKGNYILGGLGTVRVEEDGTVLLTEAGTFLRTATMENEAGIGTKTYTHIVTRVDYNRIKTAQTNGPIFFDGFVNNKDGRVDVAKDTLLIRQDGNVAVKYTGKTAKLADGAIGAKVPLYKDLDTDKDIYYEGLGVVTFWYSPAGNEMSLLSSNPPTTVGTYNVWASMSDAGRNFVAVPSNESSLVPVGQVKITAGDLESVFDKNNNVYQIIVELEAKIARPRVTVQLPSISKFGAKYDAENITVTGSASDALTSEPTISATAANDSTLTFGVDANTDFSQNIDMKVTILNNAEPPNFIGGQTITVRVIFRSKEEMKEIAPNYITVNYRDSKLSGLLAGTTYMINGSTRITATSDTTAILPAWIGDTISVQALKTTEFKFDSDVAKIYIGQKLQVNDALRAVHADSASTSTAADGRLAGTTVAMEYRLSTDNGWKPASAVVTDGLKAGTYYIRLAPIMTVGTTPGAFASDSLTIKIFPKAVIAVAEGNREIPKANTTTEAAVAPVKITAAAFTAGPSPASKSKGEIGFWTTKAVKSGSLYIFDANGNSVAKVKAAGTGKIGTWKLNKAAEGTYVVKGVLTAKDGTKEKVSFVFSVTK